MRLYTPIFASLALGLLAACSTPAPGELVDGVFDPNEASNRRTHEFNKALDRNVTGPLGTGYVSNAPENVVRLVGNVSDTLGTPSTVVNQVLQLDLAGATKNTLRFLINATLGMGGLADVATEFGLAKDESDFGETLFVWGFPEGGYMELPLLGPSTERDAVGEFVDLFTNPLGKVLPSPERYIVTGAKVLDKLGDRGRYDDLVDATLYDSADSYAQARILYLQNRRYELGDVSTDDYISPDAIDTEGF